MNLPLYTLSESESEFGEVTDRDNIITTSNINLLHNDRKRKVIFFLLNIIENIINIKYFKFDFVEQN